MILPIRLFGDPVLRKQGVPITDFNAEIWQLSQDMLDTMYQEEGIGLAAQQIGHALQLCVVDVRCAFDPGEMVTFDKKKIPTELIMPLVLINPTWVATEKNQDIHEEGCLSLPGVRLKINRPVFIRTTFQDIEGYSHILECGGILARCIQHEVDHLNGILIIDSADSKEIRRNESKLKQIKRQARDYLNSQKHPL